MNIFSIICHYGSPVRTLCLNLRSAKVTYTSIIPRHHSDVNYLLHDSNNTSETHVHAVMKNA